MFLVKFHEEDRRFDRLFLRFQFKLCIAADNLLKMEIGAGLRRPRELLKQEARDLIFFSVSPGPHRKISYSNICEVDEKRLRELGPATDFNRVGSVEIYFYSS